jgi:hypothetical protein
MPEGLLATPLRDCNVDAHDERTFAFHCVMFTVDVVDCLLSIGSMSESTYVLIRASVEASLWISGTSPRSPP